VPDPVKKCCRRGRIAKQHNIGRIFCYRTGINRLVRIAVGTDGNNTCTCPDCPHVNKPVPQNYDY